LKRLKNLPEHDDDVDDDGGGGGDDFCYRNGCATSEDLFWKLDALQSFIRDLHWPDAEFRQHLEQRLKLMACDMIESCIQRYFHFPVYITVK